MGGSASLLTDGKTTTWEGGVREPGFVHWPGKIAPRISDEVVATYDIFPTALALAGVPLPADRIIDGRDMGPVLFDSAASAHSCIFMWVPAGLPPPSPTFLPSPPPFDIHSCARVRSIMPSLAPAYNTNEPPSHLTNCLPRITAPQLQGHNWHGVPGIAPNQLHRPVGHPLRQV